MMNLFAQNRHKPFRRLGLKLVALFLISGFYASSQTTIGQWRDHFSYYNATNVVKVKNKIFCSTAYALFYYNLEDNSVEKLSICNGLSDFGVSAISYSEEQDILLVAYQNANLDLISGKNITNLNQIKNKTITGNKAIYNIKFEGNLAYLACGFGIVVLDLNNREIRETYYIGPNASAIEVYDVAIDNNNIYAATESGIYYANKNTGNLLDFNQWQKMNTLAFPDAKYTSILNLDSRIFATYYDNSDSTSTIYQYSGTEWTEFYDNNSLINKFKKSDGKLFIVEKGLVNIYNTNLVNVSSINKYGPGAVSPKDAIIDNQNTYVADAGLGLVINPESGYQSIIPNGPYLNNVGDIDAYGNSIWVGGGGYTPAWGAIYRNIEAYSFIDNNWQSYVLFGHPGRATLKVLINPYNPSQVYTGSINRGVFLFEDGKLVENYFGANCSLGAYDGEAVIVGGLVIDNQQNLYVTNSGAVEPISVKTASGEWYSYAYPEISGMMQLAEIINTVNDHYWVQLGNNGGLFAFDDNNTPDDISDDETRKFELFDENGVTKTNEIFSLAEDKDGVIWVGTDQGVVTYYNPEDVFTGTNFYADRIKITDDKVDTLVQYLLEKEKITAISIDGGNRKWFGTASSGVYLMSDDAEEELLHFTTANSPLISNYIITIDVNEKTGEVFFGTDQGIVSYKGTATEGDPTFANAYVYPNPVRPEYNGPITITGLAPNVNVKITDISGQMVYETDAFGGQAVWNGKNYFGKRVSTGVYLVFCTDVDGENSGENTKVLKLLFIN